MEGKEQESNKEALREEGEGKMEVNWRKRGREMVCEGSFLEMRARARKWDCFRA